MGQLITVTRKPSVRSNVAIFELNRSLTGMGHERFRSASDATRDKPHEELARRLFAAGGVVGIHIYSNMVTVDLTEGADPDAMEEIIRDLFTYYREGVEVVDPMAGGVTSA
jgi:hypothetical protein